MTSITGIIVPSITFFNEDFEINTEFTSVLFRHIVLNGANAILLFETEGEGIFFPEKIEKKVKLIKLAYETTEEKVPIIVGVSGNDVEDIIQQIEDLGKKFNKLSFVISPPNKEKVLPNEIKSYFEKLLSSVSPNNNIYVYNNPIQFNGNEITREIINDLIKFSNLKGIIDATDKIKNYKDFIQLLTKNFGVYCSNVVKFSTFLQLIPLELRKYSGLVSSTGNLVNICAKLYNAALEENILEQLKMQERLDDIRGRLYYKAEKGKKFIGLKYAFLYLYKDLLQIKVEDFYQNFELDESTRNIIEATVNYLINRKRIYQLYSLKTEFYQLKDVINLFSSIDVLIKQGKIKKIIGPFDGKINTIYRVNFENSQLTFRFRTSKSHQYENFIKEKVLFPLLDGTLNPYSSKFKEKISGIIKTEKGSYVFKKENPPIIPVGNLIYYDETKKVVPYLFTVQDYIQGKTLDNLLKQYASENRVVDTPKFETMFKNLGKFLGILHEINFDSFYEDISEVGKDNKKSWQEIFNKKLNSEIQEAKRNKLDDIQDVENYFKENESLIEEEFEPVLLHNDFQCQNIIVQDDFGVIRINGLIDFDDFCIGVRARDFVQINYLTLQPLNENSLTNAFYRGYKKYHSIDKDFMKRIEIYSLFWLLKLQNLETRLKKKSDRKPFSFFSFLKVIGK